MRVPDSGEVRSPVGRHPGKTGVHWSRGEFDEGGTMDRWSALGRWLAANSGKVLGAVVALTILAAFGLPRLTFATGQDSYLNRGTQVYEDNE